MSLCVPWKANANKLVVKHSNQAQHDCFKAIHGHMELHTLVEENGSTKLGDCFIYTSLSKPSKNALYTLATRLTSRYNLA